MVFLANSDGSSSVQSLVPARRLPRSAFSSLPRPQGALPLGFSATSADPPPASRRGGAGEAPGLPKRSEGNHLGYRPWSAAGVPRERIAGRAGHFPAGTPPRLSWAASPGCRMLGPPLLPSARRLGPPSDRLLPPPLELLGRQSVCKTWPWPSPVRPTLPTRRGRAALSGLGRTSPRLHFRRRAQPAPSGLQPGQARGLRFARVRPLPGIPALVRPGVTGNLCPYPAARPTGAFWRWHREGLAGLLPKVVEGT